MAEELSSIEDDTLVMFTDSDSLVQLGPGVIADRFQTFPNGPKVVVSAECFCNPVLHLGLESCARFPPAPNQYRFLNSGTYMG